MKVITAGASVATAILLWPLLPRVLQLPSAEQLRLANERMASYVKERDAAYAALQKEVEERRLAQDMLRQAQKMEAVGQLTGGIAHDFNNLLTAVLASLDRAARESDVTNPKLTKSIRTATAAAERAVTLTSQMLAFARKQPSKPVSVAVNELISNLVPILKNAWDGHDLVLDLDPRVQNVWADRNQFEQVLLNLTVNARDAMVNRGKMTIRTSMSDFAREGKKVQGVEIEVADSGCRMSEEVRTRAFDPFFTTKPLGRGSGLGLSQVYGFVQQSDGIVRLDSSSTDGTQVTIHLPAIASSEEYGR